MKKLLYTLTALIITSLSFNIASAQTWQWATASGSQNSSSGNADVMWDMTTDEHGNVYTLSEVDRTKIYAGTVSLPDGKGFDTHTLISSFDPKGKHRWSKVLGGTSSLASSIRVSKSGNVYAFGMLGSNTAQACYYDADTITPAVYQGMSLVCYDTLGKFKWLSRPDTVIDEGTKYRTLSMDIDDDGNVYAVISMPPGNKILGSTFSIPSTAPYKGLGAYVLKYSPTGSILSVTMLEKFSFTSKYYLAVPGTAKITFNKFNKGFYLAGSGIPEPGPDSLFIDNKHFDHSMYLASFTADGSLKWYIHDTATLLSSAWIQNPVHLDDSGNIFIGGNGSHTDVFNGYKFTNPLLPDRTPGMPFIMKTDSNGKLKWCVNGGGGSTGVFVDQKGFTVNKKYAVISAVSFFKNYFGNPYKDTVIVNLDKPGGPGQDAYFVIVDIKTGKTVKICSVRGEGFYDDVSNLKFSGDDLYVGGYFESTLKFDSSSITVGPSKSARDIYVAKMSTNKLSIEEPTSNLVNIKIYPNPANDILNIEQLQEGTEVRIFSISGQQVYSGTSVGNLHQVNVSAFASGTYILQLRDKDGEVYGAKIMKQ